MEGDWSFFFSQEIAVPVGDVFTERELTMKAEHKAAWDGWGCPGTPGMTRIHGANPTWDFNNFMETYNVSTF